MTAFAHAAFKRDSGAIHMTGVGANGQPINVLLPPMAALLLAAELQQEALRACWRGTADDREPFDATLEREAVEHSS